MKVVGPRSIPRQRALPTLGDTILGPIARTLTLLMAMLLLLLLLLLLLRRASLRISVPIYHRRSQTRPTAATTTESVSPTSITKQISFAHLSFPKQVPSQALAKFRSEHLPPRRARRRRWCWRG